jgi:superoxide dismutase, Cu-Zn family
MLLMKTCTALLAVSAALLFNSSLHAADHDHGPSGSKITQAVAVLHPTEGNKCRGTVVFTQIGNAVKVVAKVEGLNPGQKHGFHVHEFGDCSAPDGTSAGGHYNPEGHAHALPDKQERHAGDFGNLQADNQGRAYFEFTVKNLSIDGKVNPVIGRAVIVHADPDDGSQPTGNAGARIACGVIGVAKAPEKK